MLADKYRKKFWNMTVNEYDKSFIRTTPKAHKTTAVSAHKSPLSISTPDSIFQNGLFINLVHVKNDIYIIF